MKETDKVREIALSEILEETYKLLEACHGETDALMGNLVPDVREDKNYEPSRMDVLILTAQDLRYSAQKLFDRLVPLRERLIG